jgi:hypothetical protein
MSMLSLLRPVFGKTLVLLGFLLGTTSAVAQPGVTREFPVGSLERIDELPASRFRADLEQLPEPARERARQWLRSFHFTDRDVTALHVDAAGGICYACSFARPASPESSETESDSEAPIVGQAAVPVSPFPAHLKFHSRPGAPNVLYINFEGETVSNTEWNTVVNRTTIPALPFDTDGNPTTYSDSEQAAIKRIWQRMAEDFAPFNIDVTTERPATFNNRTAVALITRNTDANNDPNPYDFAGGVAYVDAFNTSQTGGYARFRPAWIYHNNLSNVESYIAEAASHEIGHNLGLSHDGTSSSDYYGGHGSGDISWGPLMGTGYNQNVSQWSKGDYYQANNTQDDLATIAGKISYRTDDHGNTPGAATPLMITGGTNIVSTTPENDPANTNSANKGVLSTTTDFDVFSLVTGSGPVRLAVNPWIMPAGTRGGNLDLRLELYNDSGTLLLTNNPASQTTALLQTNLSAGQYYLYVRNSGAGNPLSSSPSGYTNYGSIGQYFISGYVTDASGFVPPPVAELLAADLTATGQSTKPFTVTYSDNAGIAVATIDSSDIRVTGPNGYNQLAQFLSLDTAGNGTPRTATYAITPPGGGAWSPAHNGTYTVFMQSNQVADVEGAYVAAGTLGQFQVAVPMSIYSANLDADPGWTLQPQWQYGTPTYSGSGPTSGFTGPKIIAYNLSGNYANNLSVKYATTPQINAAGSTALTLRFRRWLGLRNIDSATIQASTDGVNWVLVWSSAGAGISDNGWQLVQYSLPGSLTGSSSLRLRWALSSGGSGGRPADIGWNLDDVELLGDGTLDTDPPIPVLNVANLTQGGSPSHNCSVTYTDATAVKLVSLDGADLVVTGPNGYSNLVEFVGADLAQDGSPLTGSYSIPAPGGIWHDSGNGTYTITLQAGAVEDTLNNATPQTLLGTFEVAINPATPGVLGVSPMNNLDSTGVVGGPFLPASKIYTLTNSGGSPLSWTANKTAAWVSLSSASGQLAVGGATTVTVSINSNATNLIAGDWPDAISFLNTTTGTGNAVRTVNLFVVPVVQLIVSANPPGWGSVSPTNGTYPFGTVVEVLASPAAYYQFIGWTGGANGTTNPFLLTLETNTTVQAQFAEIFTTNYPTPHAWLAQYGYTNEFESAVTLIGTNGMPLWQSYIAGLNPTDPQSQLRLTGEFDPGANQYVLGWNPVTGRVYTIWAATNWQSPFAPLPGAAQLPATINRFTNTVTPEAPLQFYRLEVQKP